MQIKRLLNAHLRMTQFAPEQKPLVVYNEITNTAYFLQWIPNHFVQKQQISARKFAFQTQVQEKDAVAKIFRTVRKWLH